MENNLSILGGVINKPAVNNIIISILYQIIYKCYYCKMEVLYHIRPYSGGIPPCPSEIRVMFTNLAILGAPPCENNDN